MILSGLRVFSIVDPANPVEIAYDDTPSDATDPTATPAPAGAAPTPTLPATRWGAPLALGLTAMLSGAAAMGLALRGRRATTD